MSDIAAPGYFAVDIRDEMLPSYMGIFLRCHFIRIPINQSVGLSIDGYIYIIYISFSVCHIFGMFFLIVNLGFPFKSVALSHLHVATTNVSYFHN